MAGKEPETDPIIADAETDKVKSATNTADQDHIIGNEDSGNGMFQPDEGPKDDNGETMNEKNQVSLHEPRHPTTIGSEDVAEPKVPSETPSLMPGDVLKAVPEDESTHGPHVQPCDFGSKSQADESITFSEMTTADSTSPQIIHEIKADQPDASAEESKIQPCSLRDTNNIIGGEVVTDPENGSPDGLCLKPLGVEDIKSQAEGGITVTELKKAADATSPHILDEIKNNQVDVSTEESNIQANAFGDGSNIAGGDHKQEPEPEPQPEPEPDSVSVKQEDAQNIPEKQIPVEGIHTVSPETDEHTAPDDRVSQGSNWFLSPLAVVIVAALVAVVLLPSSPAESPRKENRVDVFLRQMGTLQARFPHQRADLWRRSEIHLQRHLQMAHPTAPVSLVLTAGPRAEKTLRCLAQALASAFSLAHNASVLHIEGAGRASQDSDQVKLDIDSKLQDAFEGDKPAAIIHRFDELPPGSTLIFYRYCDHENAAYKEKFLIFTVLLEEEDDIPAKVHLNVVEEMVDDHLKKKFLTHDHPVSFDRMDIDKYGGLWSRISHLILPVAAEDRVEHGNC